MAIELQRLDADDRAAILEAIEEVDAAVETLRAVARNMTLDGDARRALFVFELAASVRDKMTALKVYIGERR